jgi:ribose transport system substrate-binding protein
VTFVALALLALAGCGEKKKPVAPNAPAKVHVDDGKTVAFVTNGVATFWNIAEAGTVAAARDFKIKAEFRAPQAGVDDQKAIIEDLLARKVDGIAVSPIDPANQQSLLNQAAERSVLITHDSDAPNTKRRYYVGINNYTAGREAGKLVKEAIPEGGQVAIFVGRLEQLNAQHRRQGVIDELLDRKEQDINNLQTDPNTGEIKGGKYTIVNTYIDQFNSDRVKAQPQDAIAKYPDVKCLVGLFAYNPPAILQAVKDAKLTGKIKIVGFDEDPGTLQGIVDGEIHGTVAQQPFQYGYQSVKILVGLLRDDPSLLPKDPIVHLPPIVIRKANVREFRDDLNAKLDSVKSKPVIKKE